MAAKMCGKKYVNAHTGPDGYLCNCVLIMEQLDIDQELFLSISLDEKEERPVITYSRHGGQALNRTLALNPADVHRLHIDYSSGADLKQLLVIGENLGIERRASTLAFLVKNLYECFLQRDCENITINPLVFTKQRRFRAANPRITIDPKSHYRQAEILSSFDITQMSPQERIAQNANLRYASRREGGNIGMITNGIGASMAIDDLIASYGGRTANFLDLYGDSAVEDVHEGLALLEFDSRVKCIVVNTFGGIFEILSLARAVVLQRRLGVSTKPIVLRIRGHHEEEARKLLEERRAKEIEEKGKSTIFLCSEMDEAAMLAVKVAIEQELSAMEEVEANLKNEQLEKN